MLSYTASIVSIVLGIVAISFALWSYVMSARLQERASNAAGSIKDSVERLSDLFDKALDRALGMVERGWEAAYAPAEADETGEAEATEQRIQDVTREYQGRLEEMLTRATEREANVGNLVDEATSLVADAIRRSEQSGEAAKDAETLQQIGGLSARRRKNHVPAGDLVNALEGMGHGDVIRDIVPRLWRLYQEKEIVLATSKDVPLDFGDDMGASTRVYLQDAYPFGDE